MIKRFLTLYRIEQKLFFRNTDVFIFNLCMPVVTLFLIGMIAGGKTAGNSGMTYLQSSYAAICAVGICCSAFMSIPIVVVDYRDKKILKRLYCSPCSPLRLLAADVMCSAVMAACIYHKGSYDSLPMSYAAVIGYIEENDYCICGNIRESYIDGVWNKDTAEEWLTEIQIPVDFKHKKSSFTNA